MMEYVRQLLLRGAVGGRSKSQVAFAAIVLPASLAAPAAGADVDDPVNIGLLENGPDRTVLRYEFGEFDSRAIRIDGELFTKITLGGESPALIAGDPSLPNVSRSIIIPDDAEMSVRVLDSQSYVIENIDIAPSKGSILRTVDPATVPYTFGEAYKRDAEHPAAPVALREPYIMRDHRGIVVTVNPFQCNPIKRTLRVYTEMTIEVAAVGPGKANVLTRPARERALSRAFHEMYGTHFLNYNLDGRYDPLSEEGGLLIIVHDMWMNEIMELANHKDSVGIETMVVPVSTIGNTCGEIRNYIQDLYSTSDLAFVLLAGDAAQVDTCYSGAGASDPTYAKIAGGDDYPEIMVGRFSAETVGQLATQIQRTIEYETMPATQTDWYWRGTGIASDQGPGHYGEYDDEHVDLIRDDLLAYGFTEVDRIYDPTATKSMVHAALNEGRGVLNYCGHGGVDSWGTTGLNSNDINILVNDNMLPWIVSVACNNGQFDTFTCFAEAWLRATHNGEPTGAIGMYASSVPQHWDEPMEAQDEAVDRFCDETYHCLGTLCYAGSCKMMDAYGATGAEMFDAWILFGDPTLRVVGATAPPTGMRVAPFAALNSAGPNGGPFTPDSLTYTLTNHDPIPLDYTVSNSAPWLDLSSTGGTIGVGETVEVVVSINAVAGGLGNGRHEDTVQFVNLTNHDGDCQRLCSIEVGVPEPVYTFDLTTDPGWSTMGEWAFGQPTGQGGSTFGGPDPTSGATGPNVYGVNLNGDYSTNPGGPYWLTTGAIDCSQLTQVSLHFQRWLNTDCPPFSASMIEVSTNGSSWTQVWVNDWGEILFAFDWTEYIYDLSLLADNEPTVYVRWGYQVASGAYPFSGWNIDDIEIWGVVSGGGQCPADVNGDAVVNVLDLLAVLAAWGNTSGPEDINGDGVVNVLDLLEILAAWGPCP